jgi:AraC-like DNA-binding protein
MSLSTSKSDAVLERFVKKTGASLEFVSLFDDIPDVECFVKDIEGRRVRVSRGIWRRLGFSSASEMIGKKDHDLFPPYIADQYVKSDQLVIGSQKPVVGQLEIWVNEQGLLDWFVVSKYPVFGRDGSVIGIMGTLRTAPGGRKTFAPSSVLGRVMEHVRENFHTTLTLSGLAEVAGLSERQLRRRFCEDFGMGLAEFVVKTRIQIASDRLLRGSDSISKIALDVGFCDQSAFTKAFRSQQGLTPREYRRRYAGRL